ncbi:MAG: DUF3450 domain-containing protein [Verrucomicrobia bacterium]|nr:DUF3450 domain-containing protein [Verrucomicrobiota bacterium]
MKLINSGNMKNDARRFFRLAVFIALCSASVSSGHRGNTQSMPEVRDLFKQLTLTQTLVSQEKNEWAQEKASIQDLLAITKEESSLLEEKIKALEQNVTTSDEEREKVLKQIEDAKKASETVNQVVAKFEASARDLVKYIPDILMSELKPLIMRLPKDNTPTQSTISQRMQTVIALMSQLEKFNGALTLNSEVKELGEGLSVEVKTLYLGLGIAYFTDASSQYSGYGKPGPDGWTWSRLDGPAAQKIATAIAIYESTMDPAFVKLPIQID